MEESIIIAKTVRRLYYGCSTWITKKKKKKKKKSQTERRKKGKFAAIHEVFEDVVKIFPTVIASDEWNTIDETQKAIFLFVVSTKTSQKIWNKKFQSLKTVNVPY